jgi:hypothetical protein
MMARRVAVDTGVAPHATLVIATRREAPAETLADEAGANNALH